MSAGTASWRPGGTSLYIHIPFCASKCRYCDFHSRPGTLSPDEAGSFVDEVLERIDHFSAVLSHVPTIYVGGGTPTLLGDELVRLVSALRSLPGVTRHAQESSDPLEFSVEANPDSLTRELAQSLAQAGATRISLGVQSLDDEVLAWLGRRHDSVSALRAMDIVRSAGMDLSVDLMCGIPVQTLVSLNADLTRSAEHAHHVSVYPLTIEEETPLASAVAAGLVQDCDPDVAADHMVEAGRVLRPLGLERYEVASYARTGHTCRHNLRYWTGGSYVGIGPSAASMLTAAEVRRTSLAPLAGSAADDARVRFVQQFQHADAPRCRPDSLEVDESSLEILSAEEAAREDAMLGLRMTDGISESLAREAGVEPVLSELEGRGLVSRLSGRWVPTERGWLLGNELYGAVWGVQT